MPTAAPHLTRVSRPRKQKAGQSPAFFIFSAGRSPTCTNAYFDFFFFAVDFFFGAAFLWLFAAA